MHTKDMLGKFGEAVAVKHLKAAGLEVISRNWRCELGEIDIVARDRDTLVICEVKTRSGLGFGTPAEAVTREKADRLRTLASRYLDHHDLRRVKRVRIDVIGILCKPDEPPIIDHIKGAA